MTIPDEVVEAAAKLCAAREGQKWDELNEPQRHLCRHEVRFYLEAAAPYLYPPSGEVGALDAYDAGLLGDGGGGDVDWWHSYLRGELERAHEFYADQIANVQAALSAATERAGRMERDATRLKEKLDEAEAKAMAAEIDARRYRYLRDRDPGPLNGATPPGPFIGVVPQNLIVTGLDADAAVDDAALRWTEEASQGEGE